MARGLSPRVRSTDVSDNLEKSTTQDAPEPGAATDEQSPQASAEARAGEAADPLAQAQSEAARLKELWMRTAADFDNFRKRTRREVDDAKKAGREELLRDVLPVFDNLERAIQSAQRATDVKAVSEGLQMIVKQLEGTLGRSGIQRVETVGKPFDPAVHEAIQQVETDEHPAGTVVAEVQPGYIQGDRLVRAAMVVVAKAKSGEAPTSN
jgi:molecular chaperone GrpE